MVSERVRWFARPETLLLAATLVLALAVGLALYALRPTTLTIAVAPRDGTEPELIQAFADALQARHREVRLAILPFDDVRESARALRDGRADLAVVRPDVELPGNALTLAVLRDQAMLVASPESAGIRTFPDLARRKLGIAAHRDADFALLRALLGYYGLSLVTDPAEAGARNAVLLVTVAEEEVAAAFAAKRIDALVAVIAPTAPKALALMAAVAAASRDGRVNLLEASDDKALIERFPRQQAVTVPAGLFGGRPKVPAEDVTTLGTSYRLMASRSLSRTAAADVTQNLFELRTAIAERTAAADYMKAPDYETTAAATSAMLPNHPGAIDYYEREQQGFIERYGDLVYLLAALAGGLGSASAWLRQRLARLRRERADVVLDRLLEIVGEAQAARGPEAHAALAREIDGLAADFVRDARARDIDARTVNAVAIAVEAARSTVAESRRAHAAAS
ncbi:TAXI family TRAP transporter solute-binding subunit [Methylobacterium sp. NEAU 140]|uniref:TAXI family TRAP transporter solute-binding subunit n=1 Tax=Methylobacterium sp. NEAU 140 TaxID=3064945 RepID=UPI0027365FEC|nr:TAXI family TRAP transporter solute-binding subunit [Methylobacterium sp. NEAU 140]MDP4026288.1 TAXI family TRAP transporter solute-binding subunit [Methylobacterium sp. NEAU 140]